MKKKIILISLFFLILFSFNFVWAIEDPTPIKFGNPLGVDSVEGFLGKITENIQSVLVTIAIIVIVVGGIMYMLSFGNERSMERAKNVLLGAVIGLAIALSAKTFLQTIWNVLGVKEESPGGKSFEEVAGSVLEFLLSIVGVIAIISLVIGGIMYMTSYGDEDRVQKGKKIIVASIIGIVVSVGAVVLIRQIGSLLGYNF